MVGLGEAGKNIVKLFKSHSKNYKIITLDEDDGILAKQTVEEYDDSPVTIKNRGLKSHAEGLLFVCGSGKIAGASLRVLEALTDHRMTIVYIKPDLEFLSKDERIRHRVHFHVLQEYARSGTVEGMIVLDNQEILKVAGTGSIKDYYEKANYFIYSIFQNLNYCMNVDSDYGAVHVPKDHSRISTLGFGNLVDVEEKNLFNLDNITESCYYMNIEGEDLTNDETILPTCQQIVRDNISKERETSFGIWESSDPNNYLVRHFTHFIQEEGLVKDRGQKTRENKGEKRKSS